MKSFYFNHESGDTQLNELNNIEEVTGKMELEQSLWMRIKTNRGEWMFDKNFGYPWLELFRKKAESEEFKEALIETVNQEERVQEVVTAEVELIDRENRKLYLHFKAKTTEGLIESSGEVGF